MISCGAIRRSPGRSWSAQQTNGNSIDNLDVGTLVACDTQQIFDETCRGWTDFSNAQLARFCLELLGEEVIVTGDRTLPGI